MKAEKTVPQFTQRDKDGFWRLVNKDGPLPDQANPHYTGLDRCWSWTASTWEGGYGKFFAQRRRVGAHRFSFAVSFASFDPNLEVIHRCDNPNCCNPSHLLQGTHKENMRDMFKKERRYTPRGAEHWKYKPGIRRYNRGNGHKGINNAKAKLRDDDIHAIRQLRTTGISQQKIADQFGVSQFAISCILLGKTWSHVKNPLSQ